MAVSFSRMSERKCAACGATDLEPGFLVESVPGGATVSTWLRGYAEFGVWRGLKLRGRELYYIEAHGCRACRYLNLYIGAPTSPPASDQPT